MPGYALSEIVVDKEYTVEDIHQIIANEITTISKHYIIKDLSIIDLYKNKK